MPKSKGLIDAPFDSRSLYIVPDKVMVLITIKFTLSVINTIKTNSTDELIISDQRCIFQRTLLAGQNMP